MVFKNGPQIFGSWPYDRAFDALMIVYRAQCAPRHFLRYMGLAVGLERKVVPARPAPSVLQEREALLEAWSAYADRDHLLDFNVIEFWYCNDNGDGTTTMFWRKNAVGADRKVPSELVLRTRVYENTVFEFLRYILDEHESIRMFEPLEGARVDGIFGPK